jgi:hypothetical protein
MRLLRRIGFRVHPCVVYPLSLVASYLHALELDRELTECEFKQLEAKERDDGKEHHQRSGQEQHNHAEYRHHGRSPRHKVDKDRSGHKSTHSHDEESGHNQKGRRSASSNGNHRGSQNAAPSHRRLVQRIICTLNEAAYSNVFAVYSLPTIACACIDINCTKRYQLPLEIPWYNVFDVTKNQLDACRRDIRRMQKNLVIDWKHFELAMKGRKWPEQQQLSGLGGIRTSNLEK